MKAVAEARSNIALVKYWGKCDVKLNLPAVPSLSFTLDSMWTRTEVCFDPSLSEDAFFLNEVQMNGKALSRVSRHLNLVTNRDPLQVFASVRSFNNFPTAAGLASSASGFAALTLAAKAAYDTHFYDFFNGPDPSERTLQALSVLARQGSGSAARSLFGGLVLLGEGTKGMADSSFATEVCSPSKWPDLSMVIGILDDKEKSISSTDAMNHTVSTSPFYPAFLQNSKQDIDQALIAIQNKDIEQLGMVTERSALRMHATAFAADPAIVYFQATTLTALHGIKELRRQGIPVWFTCDAGPHPKALTLASSAKQVSDLFHSIPSLQKTVISSLGQGAKLIKELSFDES